jgi:hypothetical protein
MADKTRGPIVNLATTAADVIKERDLLREALRPFAGPPETSEAERAIPNNSLVTIQCQLGDVRRALAALISTN